MKADAQFHENLSREEEVKGSSDRTFGLVFAGLFVVIGLGPLVHGGGPRNWALIVALAFLLLALLRPGVLNPLNRLWLQFGLLIHKVVNPIVMGLLFYIVISPMGIAMRMAGKDPLRLRREPEARSYWIERQPPGPAPDSMKHQF